MQKLTVCVSTTVTPRDKARLLRLCAEESARVNVTVRPADILRRALLRELEQSCSEILNR